MAGCILTRVFLAARTVSAARLRGRETSGRTWPARAVPVWRDPGLARNPDYRGQGLQLEFTVQDEGVFTKSWSASISYRRPLGEWPEMVCAENPHEYFSGRHSAVPTAINPDF
jgi:hypothetical protein